MPLGLTLQDLPDCLRRARVVPTGQSTSGGNDNHGILCRTRVKRDQCRCVTIGQFREQASDSTAQLYGQDILPGQGGAVSASVSTVLAVPK